MVGVVVESRVVRGVPRRRLSTSNHGAHESGGGDPAEHPERYRERSAITHVDRIERPLLLVDGVNDPRCPIPQARDFRDALADSGLTEDEDGDFEYVELGDEGHASTDNDQKIRTTRILTDYLSRRL